MPVTQVKSADMVPLMLRAGRLAAAAREAGDVEEYENQKAQLDALSRLYKGFGSTEDLLELEKARQSPLEQIGNIAKWGTLGVAAVAVLLLMGKVRGSTAW